MDRQVGAFAREQRLFNVSGQMLRIGEITLQQIGVMREQFPQNWRVVVLIRFMRKILSHHEGAKIAKFGKFIYLKPSCPS
jgi:hypothetical protein